MRRTLAAAALTGAGAASLRLMTRSRRASGPSGARGSPPPPLIDWASVRRTAVQRSGERTRLRRATAARLGSTYAEYAAELAPLMVEICGDAAGPPPAFAALDRHAFIDANLVIVRRLIDPIDALRAQVPESLLTALGRRVTSRYVGELMGMMSQRVLGQFDPVLMLPGAHGEEHPPTGLWLVEPNVELFGRGHGLPAAPLRRWLILHEATHAWQFGAHPWLGEHLSELAGGLVVAGLAEQLARPGRTLRDPETLRALGGSLRDQLHAVGRLQATMSVIEGYSNFVMHRVGRRHVPEAADLEAAFEERQRERTLLERLVLALSGIAVKLRQYQAGESFCAAVADRGGVALLNRVWEGPEAMPTMAELRAPARWVERVERRS